MEESRGTVHGAMSLNKLKPKANKTSGQVGVFFFKLIFMVLV